MLGTIGVGVVSQIFNINNFLMNFGLIGLPMGLVRYVSQFEKENEWVKIYNILKTVLIVLISFGIFLLILTLIFSKPISSFLLDTPDYYFMIILTGISVPFTFAYMTFESYLRGLKRINDYVNLGVSVILSGLVVTVVLVYILGIEGVAVAIFLSSFAGLLLYIIYFQKNKLVDFKRIYRAEIDFALFKKILGIGIGSLLVGIMTQLSIIIVRTGIIKNLGIEANGIYQAVYGISTNYFGPISIMMGAYSIPILSEISSKKDLVNKEINMTIRFILILIIPILLTTFIFREQIIVILYSSSFIEASDLFLFVIAGDFFKSYAWIMGLWLIPCKKIKAWVIIEFILNSSFITIFYILLYYLHLDLQSVTISYLISNIINLIIHYLYIMKSNEFRLLQINLKSIVISLVILLIVLFISSYSKTSGYIIYLPVIIIWGLLVFEKKEFAIVKNKLISVFNKNTFGE